MKSDTATVHGRNLTPGREFSVVGLSGRFRFHAHVERNGAAWVDCYGPINSQRAKWRCIAEDRIKTVHNDRTEER